MTVSDALLLKQWREGEATAFEEIFVHYFPPIYRLLLRLLGSADEAEDVAQEVFLKLYYQPLAPDQGHYLSAWLYRVATHLGYNALRSRVRRQRRQEAWEQSRSQRSISDPEADTLRNETQSEVRAILAELPPKQAQILFLRYQGLSYEELARIMEVRSSSVGTLLARAEYAFETKYRERYLGSKKEDLYA